MFKKIIEKLNDYIENSQIPKKKIMLWTVAMAVVIAVCFVLQSLSASENGRVFPVYINEILASNSSYPNEDGRCCDFIELYNSADYPVDLTGFQLGDISGSNRYVFPAGASIDAHGYTVVYCDKSMNNETYAQFGISRSGGEAFYLIASNSAIVDSVTTIATDLDQSMVLLETNEWAVSSTVTPGHKNDMAVQTGHDIYNAGVSPVRITELSSGNTGFFSEYGLLCDWIELHNTSSVDIDISGYTLSDNVGNDKYAFPEGSVLPSNEYMIVYCSDEPHGDAVAPFGLSQFGGESVVLKDSMGMIVQIVDTVPTEGCESLALGDNDLWEVTQLPSPGFENTSEGHNALLQAIGADAGTIIISEVMAASQLILPDAFDEFPDWVELHNTGDKTVDLTGWFLSDDPSIPDKWEIPALQIRPGQRIVVFCSGRDLVSNGEVHTDFSLSSGGESLVLSSYLGIPVDSVTFGASEAGCSFVRGEDLSGLTLTNYPTPGYQNDMTGYEQFCTDFVPSGPLAIWEVMTSNDWYLPQRLGECYDWVEIKNISDANVDLSNFSITDDPDIPGMYMLPDETLEPGGSVTIILSGDVSLTTDSHDHAGFSLNAMEDQLLLFENSGSLLDFVYLKEIPIGYSYGRSEDTGGFYYMVPTPENTNNAGYRLISSEPTSEIAPGVYVCDSGLEVPLDAEGTIYYTTDGSDPDMTSSRYEGPIQINETTVLRAISVEPGKKESDIYTATFIIQQSHSIPVVSLVTDPDNLWGKNGIYKNGDITVKEEKRAANIAYSGDDGCFSMDCEISLHGATTVTAFDKKSFTIRFQDSYDGPLNYDVFEDGEVTSFRSLIIRTSHESVFSTQMRDVLMGHIASQNCDTLLSQKYKYVALYLNGEYWGLYAIREHHSETHYASYMNVPATSVTMVKFCTDAENSLYDLFRFCSTNSLESDEDYTYAKSVLDMSSMVDWIILQSYVGNIDITGNMRYYYCSVDGLWRCGLVDLDLGMFSEEAFEQTASHYHHGKIVTALIQNDEFKDLLATRLAQLLAGPLSDENMIAAIDEIAASIRNETPMEGERWGCSPEMWETLINQMKGYCDGRSSAMIDSLCDLLSFTQAEKDAYFGELYKDAETR